MAITTSSTTAGTATSTTGSTKTVAQSAAASLLKSLGTGSDVDLGSLVPSLVDAQFAAKKAQLAKKQETVTAQISGVATLKNTIAEFSKALESLVKGGTLATQPVSSAPSIVFVVRRPANSGRSATSVVPPISFSWRTTSTPSRVKTMSGSTASAPSASASS